MVSEATNRILVVEDEPDMRDGLQKVLSRRGYSVDTAEGGLTAIEKMKQIAFTVVIADLKMPDMDGIEVLRRAKEIDRAVAVIIITGYATVASAIESMKLGAVDYITKPFKPDDIAIAVEKALRIERVPPEEDSRKSLPPEVMVQASDTRTPTSWAPEQVEERQKIERVLLGESQKASPPEAMIQASDARTPTSRVPEQVKERRILLEHCERTNAQAVEERIVTPDNMAHLAEMHPNEELHLWQWIPFGASIADIDTYMKLGGYQGLKKALAGRPEGIIAEIKESCLIGRGGAGFPTGLKWEAAFNEAASKKYFVCNAEEGEPGTFKDKMLLDQNPHKVIEGMTIGAYAIGASEGYVYIKDKYGESASLLKKAARDAQARGLLGKNILGSSFTFTLKVLKFPGAYVCGEETALCRSIEGRRPVPGIKPPFPTASGLFDRPTVINNVETLANIPHIIANGAQWFKSIGVAGSWGTKLFSITGNVNNAGVFEVELGKYTLGDLIYGLAGGLERGKGLKAVLPGGPSTSFISSEHLNVVMDYHSLKRAGTSLGAGAIIVIDETVSIPELVMHFFEFYQKESCGDCVPCRVGTKQVNDLLHLIAKPMGAMEFKDWARLGSAAKTFCVETLKRTGMAMKTAAKCGLGQAAPEPLLSSIELFGHEYHALIAKRQEEYERFVKQSSPSPNRGGVLGPTRSLTRRIGLE